MKAEGSVKQEHILDAAIKRFSHFGISKTTLTEIADDLAISKPSLFYYFSDKNGLVTAVAKKIITEFLENFELRLQTSEGIEEGLLNLVEVKRQHFKKYFLLATQGGGIDVVKISSEIAEIYQSAKGKTVAMLSNLLQKGVAQGELKVVDTDKTATILLDTLSALEHCVKDKRWIPNTEEFEELFDRQKHLLLMMLNGLRSNERKA